MTIVVGVVLVFMRINENGHRVWICQQPCQDLSRHNLAARAARRTSVFLRRRTSVFSAWTNKEVTVAIE